MKHVYYLPSGGFRHAPPFKVAINWLLRNMQLGASNPLLLVSIFDISDDGLPVRLIGYRIRRMG